MIYKNGQPAAAEPLALGTPTYARVSDLLRKDILSNRFPPGSRLKIAELSQLYGVSQMPVREALQQLQGEGLLDISPNRGASVRTVDERMIANIYDLRGAIESMLVVRAVHSVTEAQIVHLYEAEARFENAVARQDAEEAMKANRSLHLSINSIADNPEAQDIVERYSGLVSGLRRRYGFRAGRSDQMIAEHRELLKALTAGDAASASRITLEHCNNAKQDLLALMAEEKAAQKK